MRLPNAPLVEVVFEIRWNVVALPLEGQPKFGYDPAYNAFADEFAKRMADIGYTSKQTMYVGPSIAHAVVERFRSSDGSPYPLFQIGHGIAACNVSTEYEWEDFFRNIDTLIKEVYSSYPRTKISKFNPVALELRYIDIFNEDLIKHKSLLKFIGKDTRISLKEYAFFQDERFQNNDRGMFRIRKELADESVGYFQAEISTGTAGGESGIVVTSKVVKNEGFGKEWSAGNNELPLDWATKAHDVISDFFRWLVSDRLMRSFQTDKGK